MGNVALFATSLLSFQASTANAGSRSTGYPSSLPFAAAMDLLIGAEHDPDSSAYIVTHDRAVAEAARVALPGGSFGEGTMRANEADSVRWALTQRVLADVRERDLCTTILGRTHALPFGLGPVGHTGLFAKDGELSATRAAEAAGIPFCLSNFAIATVAELRQVSRGPMACSSTCCMIEA